MGAARLRGSSDGVLTPVDAGERAVRDHQAVHGAGSGMWRRCLPAKLEHPGDGFFAEPPLDASLTMIMRRPALLVYLGLS